MAIDANSFTSVSGVLTVQVSTEADLNCAILYYDANAATGSQYEIDIAGPIDPETGSPTSGENGIVLNEDLQNIDPINNASLTINSAGGATSPAIILGADQYPGFFVANGTAAFENLEFVDLKATEEDGALTVVETAKVTLQNAIFTGNTSSSGYGGDIVVATVPGGSLDIEGSSEFVAGAPGSPGTQSPGYGSGIFISGGSDGEAPGSITIGANNTTGAAVFVDSVIADGTGAGLVDQNGAGVGVGQVVIGDGSTPALVVLDPSLQTGIDPSGGSVLEPTDNLYTGGTIIKSGTLVLSQDGAAGTGQISFGSTASPDGVSQTLVTDALGASSSDGELSLQNVLTNFGQGDTLAIGSLLFDPSGDSPTAPTAVYTPDSDAPTTGILLVTGGDGSQEAFSLSNPGGTNFVVSDTDPGQADGVVEVQLAPPSSGVVGGNGGGGTIIPPTTTVGPPANNGTTTIISPPANNAIAPTLTFNPNVSVFEDEITISGTTTPGATVALTADAGKLDLGSTVGDPSGAWSLTYDKFTPGLHDFITGTATLGGLTTTAASDVDVTTGLGPKQMGFTTIQDNYDPAGDYLGTSFIKGGGGVFARDHHTILNDGGERYTYTGGSLLKDMQVTSFSASYIDDGNLTGSVLHNDDGTTYIENDAKYQFVNSHRDDTIQENGSHSHFIFHDGARAGDHQRVQARQRHDQPAVERLARPGQRHPGLRPERPPVRYDDPLGPRPLDHLRQRQEGPIARARIGLHRPRLRRRGAETRFAGAPCRRAGVRRHLRSNPKAGRDVDRPSARQRAGSRSHCAGRPRPGRRAPPNSCLYQEMT